ncbi:MAG: hydroxymethylbilane synthase [Chloroflexi bacterium]|nr:hydroxymethylbilane synthase [Chloroflexota bacterium]
MPASASGAPTLRLGTRGSALALAQSGMIADDLRALGATIELVVVRTAGDDRPPATAWGEGAFVVALEEALLAGRVDVAVHSAKDVPTAEDPRLAIAAYPAREDPRDALVCRDPGRTFATLPEGAVVGTDSPRRAALLRAARPDLRTRPLHGNVDTRLRKLAAGEADALVLAVAGLSRLGLADRIREVLPTAVALPAPGQGALAVQVRAADPVARPFVAQLDDPATRAAVEAERAFLRASGGGCRAPIGALATVEGGTLTIRGAAAADGSVPLGDAPATAAAAAPGTTFTAPVDAGAAAPVVARGERRGPVEDRLVLAAELAEVLAAELAAARPGGRAAPVAAGPRRPRALVTREPGRPGALADALRARGVEPVVIPTIELRPAVPGGPLDAAVAGLDRYAWVAVTSAAGADALAAAAGRVGAALAGSRIAAVGGATAEALAAGGATAVFVPGRAVGSALADELPIEPGDRVLLARADAAADGLPAQLRARGAIVEEVVAYHTVEAPEAARVPLRDALRDGIGALVFTSGSTVRGLLALLPPAERRAALATPACCIGPSTAAVARDHGFGRVLEATTPAAEVLADLVATAVAAPPDATTSLTAATPVPAGAPAAHASEVSR